MRQYAQSLRVLQSAAQGARQAQRLAGTRNQHNHDFGGKEFDAVAADALIEGESGSRRFLDARGHFQHLVDARGLEKFDRHPPHDEGRRLAPIRAVDQRTMVVADQAQEIRAAALAPADVAAVIDEAGKIGVLEINADGQDVPPPSCIDCDAAGKVGPALRMCSRSARRHGP